MMLLAWKWFKKNYNLVLLLSATTCLASALGKVIRGATWSLLMPVSLLAVICGWELGASRLGRKQAWLGLTVLGLPAVFAYVAGLYAPLGRLFLAALSLIPQIMLWISERMPVDFSPLFVSWAAFSSQAAIVFSRLWVWVLALVRGETLIDPLAAGLVWDLLLWLVGAWAGWQLRRNYRALPALAPGGLVLALVLDYTRGEVGLVIVYLAILLALMGLVGNEWRQKGWRLRKVDYSESVGLDTLLMVGMVTIALVLSAAGIPSLSWRDLVEKLRRSDQGGGERVAESLGLEKPPIDAATTAPYRSGGLPRSHLLDTPPELLHAVVMTVSTGELPPVPAQVVDLHPNRYHWRMITYDLYSGVGWGSSSAREVPLPPGTALLDFPQGYRLVNQHITRAPEGGDNPYVYWTGVLAGADTEIDVAWRTQPPDDPDPAHNGDMLGALTGPDEYNVVSYVPQFDADQLRATGSDYPAEITRRYLQLPDSTPERVLALARELTQAALTPYDRAVAIESYLRTFPYTLKVEPPPPGRDVVDYFLFTAQEGYCDYYASAMVVLARAVGLPARLVIGYASGEYDGPTAEYIVRQEHAHSWVEVYFSGIGWVEFEPTAGQPAIVRLGDGGASGPPPGLPAAQPALSWLKRSWRALVSNLGGRFLIAGSGLALLFILWQVGEFVFLHLIGPERAIARMYSRMERVSARLLPDLPSGHTPRQLQDALILKLADTKYRLFRFALSPAAYEIERVVALYVTQVFSAHPPLKSQVRSSIRDWTRLRWRLWVATRWLRYLSGTRLQR